MHELPCAATCPFRKMCGEAMINTEFKKYCLPHIITVIPGAVNFNRLSNQNVDVYDKHGKSKIASIRGGNYEKAVISSLS